MEVPLESCMETKESEIAVVFTSLRLWIHLSRELHPNERSMRGQRMRKIVRRLSQIVGYETHSQRAALVIGTIPERSSATGNGNYLPPNSLSAGKPRQLLLSEIFDGFRLINLRYSLRIS